MQMLGLSDIYTITIGETRLVIKHTIAHTNTDVSFALISKLFSDSITQNPNPRVLKGPPQLPRHVLFVGTAGTQSLIYIYVWTFHYYKIPGPHKEY
jgi:hypothetical protein